MSKEEIWKTPIGYSTVEASSNGDIRNKETGKLLLKHINKRTGYYNLRVFSDIDNKVKIEFVHKLVALAFLGERPLGYDINHIDTDKLNNRADNLEYCTRSENIRHAYKNGLNAFKSPIVLVETVEIYDSISDCARAIDGDPERIRQCLLYPMYRRQRHKGYHFKRLYDHDTGRRPIRVRIKETGEIFNSMRECERAIGSSHTNIMYAAKNNTVCKDLHFELINGDEVSAKRKPFLYDYQMDAVERMRNGCILCGQVGSGKSRTGLFYYFKEQGGWIDENGYVPMKRPKDLYIITTAKKRDSLEWEGEIAHFLLSTDPKQNQFYGNKIVIDSWNNLPKYKDVTGAFFLLDEQRLVSYGAWTKSFLKIAKTNDWILLSATPADSYSDYLPVFLANGFFKNKTEFNQEHVMFSRFTKYPKIDGYRNTTRLDRLRDRILVIMNYEHKIDKYHEDVYCTYDISMYKDVIRNRWNPYKNEPIQDAGGLCYVLRQIVNSDESRQVKLLEILEKHPRAIIFYNYNYERDILLNLGYGEGVEVAEWTGHKHQPLPKSEKWVYICQYVSACEGWEATSTNCVIFYSQNYSYKVVTQAAGRVDRLNTPYKELYYYHLKSRSGIDLAISKALRDKKKFNERKWTKWDQ